MAKKCLNCNELFGDEVLYCPECGTKLVEYKEDIIKPKNELNIGNIDFQALLHMIFYDYGMILAAVVGFLVSWNWDCTIGLLISGAVLYVFYFQKEKAQIFKATGIAKVLAIINVILSVWTLLS